MSTLMDLRNARLGKLDALRKAGIDPYPADSYKNIENSRIHQEFNKLKGKKKTAAGRITSLRAHGKLIFIDIKDATGKLQLCIKHQNLKTANHSKSELNFEEFCLLDCGDFIEATGHIIKTKRNEISIEATKVRILTKTLRPIPDAWEGLKDKETRLRRRYVDTNVNEEVYQRFIRRAMFWQAHREFFKSKGFLEMNIPVLESIPGGADANPFITHMDSIDEDFYLRISQELYLKRLIGGGYEKVFEIGPRFRNEGLSDEHLPEHIAMEFYWAYADWKHGMKFIKDLFSFVIKHVYGEKKVFKIRGFDVDFSKDWKEIDFTKAMQDKYDIDVNTVSLDDLKKIVSSKKIKVDFKNNKARAIDILWKDYRKEIAGPAFLVNHPKFLSPLSKSTPENPNITERFQPIIAGSELGNGWSEINDPLDQFERFKEQQSLRDAGDKEAQWLDIDYVEMLEYGMPPTFGYGHSERVFWFLEDVSAKEGVPFPQLKFELEENTRKIYGL